MQKALFDEKLRLKKLNDDDYVTIKDLDYSQPVADLMFQHKKTTKSKPKRSKGGVDHKALPSRIQDKSRLLQSIKTSLPLPLALIPEGTGEVYEVDDEDKDDSEIEKANADELDKDNASRAGKNKIKRQKLPKHVRRRSTHNDSRNQRVTRSMEKELEILGQRRGGKDAHHQIALRIR